VPEIGATAPVTVIFKKSRLARPEETAFILIALTVLKKFDRIKVRFKMDALAPIVSVPFIVKLLPKDIEEENAPAVAVAGKVMLFADVTPPKINDVGALVHVTLYTDPDVQRIVASEPVKTKFEVPPFITVLFTVPVWRSSPPLEKVTVLAPKLSVFDVVSLEPEQVSTVNEYPFVFRLPPNIEMKSVINASPIFSPPDANDSMLIRLNACPAEIKVFTVAPAK
jgi:hypothetical protein